jgi:hypothetical protein
MNSWLGPQGGHIGSPAALGTPLETGQVVEVLAYVVGEAVVEAVAEAVSAAEIVNLMQLCLLYMFFLFIHIM